MLKQYGFATQRGWRMKRFIRYGVVPIGIFFILLVVTVILVPVLINVQKFVPAIERQISDATGRSFSLGPDLGVSFFPWLSISFSDMKIGNPPGFSTEEFVKIRTFEARIKVLPLLKNRVEISRFVIGGLSVNLEKNSSGKMNWQFAEKQKNDEKSKASPASSLARFSEKFSFALLAVTDGQVHWIDKTRNVEHRIEDIMLLLNDFTPKRPFALDCKATFNGKPVALEGKIGPMPGGNSTGEVSADLAVNIVNKLRGQLQGTISLEDKGAAFQMLVRLPPFSPREFFSTCELPFPFEAGDPETFKSLEVEFLLRGSKGELTVEKGLLRFDESQVNFSLKADNPAAPHLAFSVDLDKLDLDRYLPPAIAKEKMVVDHEPGKEDLSLKAKRPGLWGMAMSGDVRIAELKVHGGALTEVNLPLQGANKVFTLTPATAKTAGGQLQGSFTLDLQNTVPAIQVNGNAKEIQVEPFLQQYFGREFLRGSLNAESTFTATGDDLAAMIQSLKGEATLKMGEGALVGVDLTGMETSSVNDAASSNAGGSEKSWTDFSEAKSVLTVADGLLQLRETELHSPVYKVQLGGSADLVEKQLNLQMENTFITTIIGKKKQAEQVSNTSFYAITGTFSEPLLKIQNNPGDVSSLAGKIAVQHLVERKLPSPGEEDGKNLVGKDLVDPAVVAQRFNLQRGLLRRGEVKKRFPLGSGTVRIGTLQEEAALR